MESVAIYSRKKNILDLIPKLFPAELARTTNIQKIHPDKSILEFLRFEIPELVILHMDPKRDDFDAMFKKLEEDPWLESVSFILIAPDVEALMEKYRGFNISYFLDEWGLERNLGRVISMLAENKYMLNRVDLIKKLTTLTGELVIETEVLLVQYYAAFFSNYLYKEGYVSQEKKYAVHLTLTELLYNAMEHGNAGITYEEKSEFLSKNANVQDLIEARMRSVPYAGRRVVIQYSIDPVRSVFSIADEGDGFDTSQVPTRETIGSLLDTHGRGIFLSMNSVDDLRYNDKGNAVTIEIRHNGSAERIIPPGFVQSEPKTYEEGDLIFAEDEAGDNLYYIVSGEYTIYIKGKKITSLTPGDIFLGEMSFLLGNKRSATVVASKRGKLVEISREAFTEAVKKYPNYAIFLSKLLARRLREANLRYVGHEEFTFGG